jgi:hypothetical protein
VKNYLRNLNEERFILPHVFRDFSPWSLGRIAVGPWQGRISMVRRMWQRKAAQFMVVKKQREDSNIPFNDTPTITLQIQPPCNCATS